MAVITKRRAKELTRDMMAAIARGENPPADLLAFQCFQWDSRVLLNEAIECNGVSLVVNHAKKTMKKHGRFTPLVRLTTKPKEEQSKVRPDGLIAGTREAIEKMAEYAAAGQDLYTGKEIDDVE